MQMVKDDELFVVDVKPTGPLSARNRLLNKKKQRDKNYKKLSLNEERLIKRIVVTIKKNEGEEVVEEKKVTDLWGDDDKMNNNKSYFKFPPKVAMPIVYPKVPLPHPGQSYNPSKVDLTNLLTKVAYMNRVPELMKPDEKPVDDLEAGNFPLSDEEEEEYVYNEADFKVSNNPAVDDFTQRKTIKERKKINRLKELKQKEKDFSLKKENRIKLNSAVGIKKVEKSRLKKIEEEEGRRRKLMILKKEREELIKNGIVDDKDLLRDFQVKKRRYSIKEDENKKHCDFWKIPKYFKKRNVVGEFNHNHRVRSRANKKLNKFKQREGGINNIYDDYGYSMGDTDKLKIFE